MAGAHGSSGGPVGKPFFLTEEGSRFDFFQAVRLAERLRQENNPVGEASDVAGEAVRFTSNGGLAFPATDLHAVEGGMRGTAFVLRGQTLERLGRLFGADLAQRLRVIEDHEFTAAEYFRARLSELLKAEDFLRYGEHIITEARRLSPVNIEVNFMGLAGPHGPLPLAYTELVLDRLRDRDTAMRDFFDIFNHRLVSLFYRGRKLHRPGFSFAEPEEDTLSNNLFALIGLGPRAAHTQSITRKNLLRYAGLLSAQVRSVDGLETLLGHYFQVPVRVEGHRSRWLSIDPSQHTFLGTANHALKAGTQQAALGTRIWDSETMFRVHVGPLPSAEYRRFFPEGGLYRELCDLVRFYVGPEPDFDVRLILRSEDASGTVLDPGPENGAPDLRPRLGRNTFLKSGTHRTTFRLSAQFFERLVNFNSPKLTVFEQELGRQGELLNFLRVRLAERRFADAGRMLAALRHACGIFFRDFFRRHAPRRAEGLAVHYEPDEHFFQLLDHELPGLTSLSQAALPHFQGLRFSSADAFQHFMTERYLERYGETFRRVARKTAAGHEGRMRLPDAFFQELEQSLPEFQPVIAAVRGAADAARNLDADGWAGLLEREIGEDREVFYRACMRSRAATAERDLRALVEHPGSAPLFEGIEEQMGLYHRALADVRRQAPGAVSTEAFFENLRGTLVQVRRLRGQLHDDLRFRLRQKLTELRPSTEFLEGLRRDFPEAASVLDDLRAAMGHRFFSRHEDFLSFVHKFLSEQRIDADEAFFLARSGRSGEYGLPLEFFTALRRAGGERIGSGPADRRSITREMRRALGSGAPEFYRGYRRHVQRRERFLVRELMKEASAPDYLSTRLRRNFEDFCRTKERRQRDDDPAWRLRLARRRPRPWFVVDERLRSTLSACFGGGRALFPFYTARALRKIRRQLRLRGSVLRRFAESLPAPEYFARGFMLRLKAHTIEDRARFFHLTEQIAAEGTQLYDDLYRRHLLEDTDEPEEYRRVFLRAFQMLLEELPDPADLPATLRREMERGRLRAAGAAELVQALPEVLTRAETIQGLVLLKQFRRRLPVWSAVRVRADQALRGFLHLAPDDAAILREAQRRLDEYSIHSQYTYQEVLRSVLDANTAFAYRNSFLEDARSRLQPVRRIFRLDERNLRPLELKLRTAGIRIAGSGLRKILGREFESREQLEWAVTGRQMHLPRFVRRVLAEVADRPGFRDKAELFYMSGRSLRRLRVDVPDYLLGEDLRSLRHRLFRSRTAFLEALSECIGRFNTIIYEQYFLQHARLPGAHSRYALNQRFEQRLRAHIQRPQVYRAFVQRARQLPFLEYHDGEELWRELTVEFPVREAEIDRLRRDVLAAARVSADEIAVVLESSEDRDARLRRMREGVREVGELEVWDV